jgi:hypothetical protein
MAPSARPELRWQAPCSTGGAGKALLRPGAAMNSTANFMGSVVLRCGRLRRV